MLAGLMKYGRNTEVQADMEAVGSYLTKHSDLPWIRGSVSPYQYFDDDEIINLAPPHLEPISYLGAAAILVMSLETDSPYRMQILAQEPSRLGPIRSLYIYAERGLTAKPGPPLPDLPLPDEFKQVFRDWAEGRVNFTAPPPGSCASGNQ